VKKFIIRVYVAYLTQLWDRTQLCVTASLNFWHARELCLSYLVPGCGYWLLNTCCYFNEPASHSYKTKQIPRRIIFLQRRFVMFYSSCVDKDPVSLNIYWVPKYWMINLIFGSKKPKTLVSYFNCKWKRNLLLEYFVEMSEFYSQSKFREATFETNEFIKIEFYPYNFINATNLTVYIHWHQWCCTGYFEHVF
jgi:hypothetical protein